MLTLVEPMKREFELSVLEKNGSCINVEHSGVIRTFGDFIDADAQ